MIENTDIDFNYIRISEIISEINYNVKNVIVELSSNAQSNWEYICNEFEIMKSEIYKFSEMVTITFQMLPEFFDFFFLNQDFIHFLHNKEEYENISKLRIDPLVLDLDGDGLETTDVKNGVHFDIDNNGFMEKTAWIGSDDGILVMDRNKDGKINSGAELFGDRTVLKNGKIAGSGFEALADLDGNKDGKIDVNDSEFKELRVWRDFNQDGKVSDGELFDLQSLKIKALNLDKTLKNGLIENLTSSFRYFYTRI